MRYCYSDFTHTVIDYFSLLKKREIVYEFGIPVIASIIFIASTDKILPSGKTELSAFVTALVSLLVNVFAILVGFSVAAVAIFTSIDHSNNKILNKMSTDRTIKGKYVTNFRFVYANFIYSAFASIMMLVFTISCYLLAQIIIEKYLVLILIMGSLHVLLLSLRNITTLYFSFAYPEGK